MQRSLTLPRLAVLAFVNSVVMFGALAQAYTSGSAVVQIDARLADTLHANVFPSATTALTAVTTLGSTLVLVLVVAGASAYLVPRGRGRDALLLVLAAVGAQLLTWILKALFERPRPSFEDPVATAGWFSFPSGHALSSIAVYGALAFVIGRGRRSSALLAGLALLVAAIGFSRLYLGVHYLSDVLAGFSAGFAWLLLAIALVHARGGDLVPAGVEDRQHQCADAERG
jgi:membrane-associated phospholipid phosphatase